MTRSWQAGEALWPEEESWGSWRLRLGPNGYRGLLSKRLASVVMSNGERERLAYQEFLRRASGRVLCFGLGMGWSLAPLLHDLSIERLEVVELDSELVEWVGAKLLAHDARGVVRLHQGSAWEWSPDPKDRWDTIFLDVWHELPLRGLQELEEKWAAKLTPDGWLGRWQPALEKK